MSKTICDACGVEVSSWSARYGDYETIFCKKCYETAAANAVIAKKVISSDNNEQPKNITMDVKNIDATIQNIIVTDIKMPFGSMVVFMIKWVIASIPALIILFLVFGLVSVFLGGIGIMYR